MKGLFLVQLAPFDVIVEFGDSFVPREIGMGIILNIVLNTKKLSTKIRRNLPVLITEVAFRSVFVSFSNRQKFEAPKQKCALKKIKIKFIILPDARGVDKPGFRNI